MGLAGAFNFMYNEEQMEAAAEHLKRINEKHERQHGWRPGIISETRQQGIKRIRRWRNLQSHFPDKYKWREDNPDRSFINSSLVRKLTVGGIDLMVTGHDRLSPVWSWDKSELLPVEEWRRIRQYNGYCRFMRKPVIERGYNGILTYIPVHGGITYCEHKLGVSTYGFDTAHADDEENEQVRNLEWMEFQCHVMAQSIKVAARFEPEYLRFNGNDCKGGVLHRMDKAIFKKLKQPFKLTNNLGAMLNLLSGKL